MSGGTYGEIKLILTPEIRDGLGEAKQGSEFFKLFIFENSLKVQQRWAAGSYNS